MDAPCGHTQGAEDFRARCFVFQVLALSPVTKNSYVQKFVMIFKAWEKVAISIKLETVR